MYVYLNWNEGVDSLADDERRIIDNFEKDGVVDLDTGYSHMEAQDIRVYSARFDFPGEINSDYVLIDLNEVKNIRKASYYLNGKKIGRNTCSNVECRFVVPKTYFKDTNSLMTIVTDGVSITCWEKHAVTGGEPDGYTTELEEMHKKISLSEVGNFSDVIGIEKKDNKAVILFSDNKCAELTFYEKGIFRFNLNNGEERLINELCLDEFYRNNEPCNFDFSDNGNKVILTKDNISVEIYMAPFAVKIKKNNEKLTEVFANNSYNTSILRIPMDADEAVFALGESAKPKINKRGTIEDIWVCHDPVYCDVPIPYYISSRGYGLYLNSSYHSIFDMGCLDNENIIVTNFDDVLDFFIFTGDNAKEFVDSYITVTGNCALPPKWVFGLWQAGGNVNKSAKVCKEVIETYKKHKIPLDCVCIDPGWENDFTDLKWDKNNFPQPDEFIKYVKDNNIEIVLWTTPFINRSCDNYDSAVKEKMLFTDKNGDVYPVNYWKGYKAGIIDFTNPDTVDKWSVGVNALTESGIAGYKIDGGDNSEFPYDMQNYRGKTGSELHNLFPVYFAKAYKDIHEKSNPGKRSVTWERTGFVGSGKYPCTWGGDQFADFDGLQVLIKAGQQAGLCGIPFWAEDVGGFSLSPKTTEEFFIRSYQWGMIAPLSRAHGPKTEPWAYGEKALSCIEKYIRLRYKLFPYIYSMAHKAYFNKTPIMRPLFYDYFDDKNTYDCDYQYLFGDGFMVAPIYDESGRNDFVATRKVYFPEGEWIDFNTGDVISGGSEYDISADLKTLPLYIKKGAIIPYTKMDGNTKSYDVNNDLRIEVYPSEKLTCFDLYDDDGETTDYQNGKYTKINITNSNNVLKLHTVRSEYLSGDIFNLDICAYTDKPNSVLVNGYEKEFEYSDGKIMFNISFNINKDITIEWK